MASSCTGYDSVQLISSSTFHSSDDIINNPNIDLRPKSTRSLYQRVRQWLDRRLTVHSLAHSCTSVLISPHVPRKSFDHTAISTEEHSKRRFSTKREDIPDIKLLLQEGNISSSTPRCVNESWADLSCSSMSSPRTSLTGTSPPYKSSDENASPSSTPSTPSKFYQIRRSHFKKSVSENVDNNNKKSLRRLLMVRTKWKSDEPHTQECIMPISQSSTLQERRRNFAASRKKQVLVPDEEFVRNSLGEWYIPFEELEFKKQIAFSEDTQIFSGRWHGDVVVHEFRFHKSFNDHIQSLLQIRHENIILYMGGSIASRKNAPSYLIVTNDHGGTSLFNKLKTRSSDQDKLNRLDIAKKVASAMGYLHAKDIIHGQLTTKNVFISNYKMVYLSLLDYSVSETGQILKTPEYIFIQRCYSVQRK
ncbi:KSR2 [Lepeophtheirus salmonis]|uniref:KSR2 n=1 Tax=Lepeophtheirus salmonis TaxID=72036 RepID=A0A7R8CTL2_LEPSM|nr:KSR2 [Lepeophtheirus salmonis]CAF2927277.1 KSR2 [Lepeophtheirus salmonis]